MAGLLADARQLLSVARDEAKQYKYDYGVSIPVKVRPRSNGEARYDVCVSLVLGRSLGNVHACVYVVRFRPTVRLLYPLGFVRKRWTAIVRC